MDRYLTETSANLRCARRVDSAAAAPYIRVLTDAVSWPAVIQLRSRTNRLICIQETRDRGGARNMTKNAVPKFGIGPVCFFHMWHGTDFFGPMSLVSGVQACKGLRLKLLRFGN